VPELFVLCHRDYHSRNILIRENDFLIIDFQDARLGLPLYDVVSLLRDSYAFLPEAMIAHLKSHYYNYAHEQGIPLPARDEFERLYYLSAFQRNVKALGTFGYQIYQRKKKMYEQYIDRTIGYIETYIQCEEDISQPARIILDCIGNRM
jgi:aminoglycoside/choline kinase family phosphotransferase